jgi:Cft2 family RNA processing exonuclease
MILSRSAGPAEDELECNPASPHIPVESLLYDRLQVPLRMSVDAISFSAHADFPQTSEFIDELQPRHVVLVHGEATEMGRLKRALEQRATATGQQRSLYMPRVTQPVHITHKTSYTAKVRGLFDCRSLWRNVRSAGDQKWG